jgi:hypothetical protein
VLVNNVGIAGRILDTNLRAPLLHGGLASTVQR